MINIIKLSGLERIEWYGSCLSTFCHLGILLFCLGRHNHNQFHLEVFLSRRLHGCWSCSLGCWHPLPFQRLRALCQDGVTSHQGVLGSFSFGRDSVVSGLTPSPDFGSGTPFLQCLFPGALQHLFMFLTRPLKLHYLPCTFTALAGVVVHLHLNIGLETLHLNLLHCLPCCIHSRGALLQ